MLFTMFATVMAHPVNNERNFDAVIAYLSQFIKKQGPTLSIMVASITQTRPKKRLKTSVSLPVRKHQTLARNKMLEWPWLRKNRQQP